MAQDADRPSGQIAIGPVTVAAATRDQALTLMLDAIDRRRPAAFAFANAHTINLARHDPQLRDALAGMTVFNDGIGVDIAARLIHGYRFPDNLNGTDLTPALLEGLRERTPVYLLGSAPGVAARAAERLTARFPRCEIVGVRDGFFAEEAGAAVAAGIAASGARLVLIGMGQPRQEYWAARYGASVPAALCCIGAYLDFSAGVVPRAPGWIRAMRAEWVFRLACEPRRLARRYLIGNAVFLSATAGAAIRRRLGRDAR